MQSQIPTQLSGSEGSKNEPVIFFATPPDPELLIACHVLNLPFNSAFLALPIAALFQLPGLLNVQFSSQFYILVTFLQNGPSSFSFDIWQVSAALLGQMLTLCPPLSNKILHVHPLS